MDTGESKNDQLPKVHIEWDSGMKRLGFPVNEATTIANKIKEHRVMVASTFSHLVSSNNAQHDHFTQGQIDSFSTCAKQLEKLLDSLC